MSKGLAQTSLALIIAAISLLGTVYIEFTHNDRENATKIAALESHRQDDADKLDHIQAQVDRLVEWAMGKR